MNAQKTVDNAFLWFSLFGDQLIDEENDKIKINEGKGRFIFGRGTL